VFACGKAKHKTFRKANLDYILNGKNDGKSKWAGSVQRNPITFKLCCTNPPWLNGETVCLISTTLSVWDRITAR
jgi:hypothetical protein